MNNQVKIEYQQEQPLFRLIGQKRILMGKMLYEKDVEKIYDSPPISLIRQIPLEKVSKVLENQIKIVQCLNHPNIMKIFEVFEENGYKYILKQKCDGPIAVYEKTQQLLDDVFRQILTVMNYLQNLKLLHRNIKKNTIYTNDNVCKLKGFGYSIILDDENDYIQGDPHEDDIDFEYRCPEMLKGQKYGMKSDVWSLGILFYELIYDRKPWQAQNIKQYLLKIQKQQLFIPHQCKYSPILKQMLQISQFERCEWDVLFQIMGLYVDQDDRTERLSLMISLSNLGKDQQAMEILEEQLEMIKEYDEQIIEKQENISIWMLIAFGILLII